MRARYYNPEIKRFINQDVLLGSISDSTSLNRYSYVNGNPINLVDPFGLEAQSSSSDWHSFLGFSGFLPFVGMPFDIADAIFYGFEGNWGEAGISALAIVPIAGDAGKAGIKVTKAATINKTGKYFPYGEDALKGVVMQNKRYAGTTQQFTNKALKKYPGIDKKYPNGVKYDDLGFPDFSPYSEATIKVNGLTGKNSDFTKADKVLGLKASDRKGYTWHHVEDGKTMMLVPSDIHESFRHTGGATLLRKKIVP